MPNPLTNRMRSNQPVLNGWLSIPSGFSAELMACANWDSLTVDLQHGLQDYASMISCFQAITGRGIVPLVRVPSNDASMIGRVLDAGAQGVICPLINTVAETQAFVSACRYPPVGNRSYGPIRAILRAGEISHANYPQVANETVLCLAMIETARALDNLAAILEVDGVDGVYVGPADLGMAVGLPPKQDREEPEILELLSRILSASNAAGKFAAIHGASPAYAVKAIAMGFRLVTVATDAALVLQGAAAAVKAARSQLAKVGGIFSEPSNQMSAETSSY